MKFALVRIIRDRAFEDALGIGHSF
jgi:hypothetical protein